MADEQVRLGIGQDRAQHEAMDVELLVVDECPHEGSTAAVLRRALDDVGLQRARIRTRVISSEQEARRLQFVGSPTIRIDGQDPFGADGRLVQRLGRPSFRAGA